ncbi:hypothetical protein PSTT_09241, partial [Puccinia striiformis]
PPLPEFGGFSSSWIFRLLWVEIGRGLNTYESHQPPKQKINKKKKNEVSLDQERSCRMPPKNLNEPHNRSQSTGRTERLSLSRFRYSTDLDRTQRSKTRKIQIIFHLPSNQPRSRHPIPHLPVLGLSRVLSKSMKVIAKKSVLRMDPSVKRSICRSCHLLLIPGTTSTTKILRSSSHRHKVKTRCLSCSHERQIPHPPKPKQDPTDRSGGHEHELMSEKKRSIPFWNQPQHLTFVGQTLMVEGSL